MAAIVYYRQGLTGDGTTDLDEVDGAVLNDGDPAFVFTGTSFYCYRLDATSGATASSPDVIEPTANAVNKRWILQGVQSVENGVTVLSKSATYPIVPADLAGCDTLVVLVDASSADVIITLPTPANYDGKKIHIITDVDPGGTAVITKKSGATEWHTGYAKGDFLLAVSDGTNDIILDEFVTVTGLLTLTTDDTSSTGYDQIKIFDAGYTVEIDTAGWWDSTTNHRIDIGFDCLFTIHPIIFTTDSAYTSTIFLNGNVVVGNSGFSQPVELGVFEIEVSSGDYIEIYAMDYSVGEAIIGDAAKDGTRATWRVIRRLR